MTTSRSFALTFTTDDEIDADTLNAVVQEALSRIRYSGMPIGFTPEGGEVWIEAIDGETEGD